MSDFVWSLKNGDLDQVKEYVESKGVDINESVDGRNPIHYAADYGQKEIVEYLISRGANVNATDKHGISALLAAIWEGHTACVKFMIDKGANKCGHAPDGTNYLDCAEKQEIKDMLKIILASSHLKIKEKLKGFNHYDSLEDKMYEKLYHKIYKH